MVKMNSDLKRERDLAVNNINVERITNLLDGGSSQQTERRRQLRQIIEKDPTGVFDNSNNAYLHRSQRHVRSLAKHVRLVEICRQIGIGSKTKGEIVLDPDFMTLLILLGDDLPTALHWVMFVPNIMMLCDEKQRTQWLAQCRDWKMIGCYAQTELGHGSNVRALETTATFVKDDNGDGSFVINSPTLTSGKFWPGTLGKTANHAMVIARLIDGSGQDRGIHNFLVPLRNQNDHTLLEGVQTGDIGPKIGYNIMDNGYAFFDNVKIPRRNMAMRFAYVDENGNYSKKTGSSSSDKVAYITMMQVRAHIIYFAGINLAIACTIAIRYSAVRRQGYDTNNASANDKKELQILDYKQQQHRLFPLLAASYCFFFTGKKVQQNLKNLESKLVSGGGVTKAEMQDAHASLSALKSFTSMIAADGMEECRKSCGGHGFLECSGLPELITSYLQNPTVEGDNHMLPQQVIKVLLKLVQAVVAQQQKGGGDNKNMLSDYESCDSSPLIPSLKAILLQRRKEQCSAQCESDMMDIHGAILPAFCHRAARLLVEVAAQLQMSAKQGKTEQQGWNDALVLMARSSRAYSQFLLMKNFVDGIQSAESANIIGSEEARVMSDLARLFGLYWMERELGDFMEDGYLSSEQSKYVHSCVLQLLDTIRPNAVPLVDAWDFSDFKLKSALGRYDGDVYPAIMDAALRDPLNQQDPGLGYEEHLKRLIVGGVGAYSTAGTASRL